MGELSGKTAFVTGAAGGIGRASAHALARGGADLMIVDIYTHIFPERFFQELERGSPKLGNMGKRLRSVRKLFDLDLRFKDMDEIGDDYRQIISLPNPPIEDIVEKHLKLRVEFDDLHRLLGVSRGGFKPDIFGAIWLETGEIVIDESLDPEERPSLEGRYRFTLAHEGGGHWRLHGPLVQANRAQQSLFGDMQQPTVVCRSSQAKERVEVQADLYASCLLMPRKLVMRAWRDMFGNDNARVLRRKDRIVVPCDLEEEPLRTDRSIRTSMTMP